MLSEFGYILLFIIAGILFVSGGLFTSRLLRPKRPNEEKRTVYESGEDPTGNAWGNFNVRFFVVALVFLIFEVEIAFLIPWATIFGSKELAAGTPLWTPVVVIEMAVFLGVLILGLAYAWRKGYIDWVRPAPKVRKYKGPVPKELYDRVNENYESRK